MTADPAWKEIATSPVAQRGPTALRIMVGGQLRKLREARGITPQQAGDRIRGSHAKISRLELGRTGYKERDVSDLLTLYGVVDPEQRESFLKLVRMANDQGWWHGYSDLLPSWFENYLGLEGAAQWIRTYEGQLVPGLLQTDDYARAVVTMAHNDHDVIRRVELRRKRQAILDIPGGPSLWAILDESVLRRPVGGRAVLRAQLEHLLKMSHQRNITIQVLPYADSSQAAVASSFAILRFAEEQLPDIVYLEQISSALYLDRPQDLETYRHVMDCLSIEAASPVASRALLAAAAEQLK
ncbi:helix-turn-helix domain-containing protein [Nocardia sp. NEAU-G5]|uniref:Helix-turn-helix domain-containing protein n=1 Tax=Nocardia albiluteola TaxID=2842303 RepID=A0ABS6B1B1_9NOCA|nr:helix-turn-helix transcriptional regulator [Nocardia albiluteola]MBU3063014.1 helix-turn-helix domain-containing protein [Nocardia albiluteola]